MKSYLIMLNISIATIYHHRLSQLIGFLFAGFSSTVVHYASLFLFVEIFAVFEPVTASIIALLLGSATGFILNKFLVFRNDGDVITALYKYTLLTIFNSVVNASIMHVFVNSLHIHYFIAQIIATASMVLINFNFCSNWIFKDQEYG